MVVYKIDGIGNDFCLISFLHNKDDFKEFEPKLANPDYIKNLCLSTFDQPVDGLVILLPPDSTTSSALDFQWKFFNSDASTAEMCGNAARAVSWWYYQNEQKKLQINFLAHDLKIQAQIFAPEDVEVSLVKVKTLGPTSTGHFLYDSGVPHLIYLMQQPQFFTPGQIDYKAGTQWADKAKSLRFPKELNAAGSNVTLVWKKSDQHIAAISFERGVENWTMACGTGAMAAATYAEQHLGMEFPITVTMPGGDLRIRTSETSSYLRGPAKILEKKPIQL